MKMTVRNEEALAYTHYRIEEAVYGSIEGRGKIYQLRNFHPFEMVKNVALVSIRVFFALHLKKKNHFQIFIISLASILLISPSLALVAHHARLFAHCTISIDS